VLNYQHKELAGGRWFEFSLPEQLANVGSEIGRAINWKSAYAEASSYVKTSADKSADKKAKVAKYSDNAFFRGLELLSLTIDDPKNKLRLKELTRLYEALGDYFMGENIFQSSDELWNKYFYFFNHLVRSQNGKF